MKRILCGILILVHMSSLCNKFKGALVPSRGEYAELQDISADTDSRVREDNCPAQISNEYDNDRTEARMCEIGRDESELPEQQGRADETMLKKKRIRAIHDKIAVNERTECEKCCDKYCNPSSECLCCYCVFSNVLTGLAVGFCCR